MKSAREKCALLRQGIPLSAYDHTLVFQNGEFLETSMGLNDSGHYFHTDKLTWREVLAIVRGNLYS